MLGTCTSKERQTVLKFLKKKKDFNGSITWQISEKLCKLFIIMQMWT